MDIYLGMLSESVSVIKVKDGTVAPSAVKPSEKLNINSEQEREKWIKALNKRELSILSARNLREALMQKPQEVLTLGLLSQGNSSVSRSRRSRSSRRLSLPNSGELMIDTATLPFVTAVSTMTTSTTTLSRGLQTGAADTVVTTVASCASGGLCGIGGCLHPHVDGSTFSPEFTTQQVGDSNTMGMLRNGKIYSPARGVLRADPALAQSTDRVEKRKPSGSPTQEEMPAQKRTVLLSTNSDHVIDHVIDEMELGRTVELSNSQSSPEPNPRMRPDEIDNAAVFAAVKSMEKMMEETLGTITKQTGEIKKQTTEMNEKSEKCMKELNDLKKSVEENKKEIGDRKKDALSLKKSFSDYKVANAIKIAEIDTQIISVNTDLTDQIRTREESLGTRLKEVEELNRSLNERVVDLERKLNDRAVLDTETESMEVDIDRPGNDFPVNRTLVMRKVRIQEGKTAEDAVRLVLVNILGLNQLTIVKVKDQRKFKDGTHTVLVRLSSADEINTVMESKSLLNTATSDAIRSIWIKRSRSERQRIQDHNYQVMLKAMKMQDRFRADHAGRLVPRLSGHVVEADTGMNRQGDDSDRRVSAGHVRGTGRGAGRGRGRRGGSLPKGSTRVYGPQRPPLALHPDTVAAYEGTSGSVDGSVASGSLPQTDGPFDPFDDNLNEWNSVQ